MAIGWRGVVFFRRLKPSGIKSSVLLTRPPHPGLPVLPSLMEGRKQTQDISNLQAGISEPWCLANPFPVVHVLKESPG